jgi:hypothetical protein
MARTALTVTTLTPNTPLAGLGTTTNIDATNSHSITFVSAVTPGQVILVVANTTASTKTVTVKAGVNPPAVRTGGGDMTALSLTDGSVTTQYGIIGPFEASRYMQANGTINVDVAASMTGTITVLYIPRTV